MNGLEFSDVPNLDLQIGIQLVWLENVSGQEEKIKLLANCR
jgi:hypothetical protein